MSRFSKDQRTLFRLAGAICDRYHQHTGAGPSNPALTESWIHCEALKRRLQLAGERGWRKAADRVRVELISALENHMRRTDWALQATSRARPAAHPVKLHDVYHDLLVLQIEFSDFRCDLRQGTLSVATDPITLDDVYLGPFAVELHWSDLPQLFYDIKALNARPAGCNESVVHPHVSDGDLCTGEASLPIQNALKEGRLLDFFQVVANTLATYNAQSAYVSLANWGGAPCSDCDESVAADDRSWCNDCGNMICEDCDRGCETCSSGFCYECLAPCELCEDCCCSFCLKSCTSCGKEVCPQCRESERCSRCHDEMPGEEEPDEVVVAESSSDPAASQAGGAAVQSPGLGQTVVLA